MTDHRTDSECTLDASDSCTDCGVYHGEPCTDCGSRGFHSDGCPEMQTYSIRRPGCAAWCSGIFSHDVDYELAQANQVAPGHVAVMDQ